MFLTENLKRQLRAIDVTRRLVGLFESIASGAELMTGAIRNRHLEADILSADAAGRAKVADGFVTTDKLANDVLSADAAGRGKMRNGFVTNDKIADGTITANKLVTPPLSDSGSPMQNLLHLTAVAPTEGDIVELGADVYEYRASTPPAGGTAGRTWVHIGANVSEAANNMVAAINGVVDAALITRDGGPATENFLALRSNEGLAVFSADAPGGVPIASDVPVATASTLSEMDARWAAADTFGGSLPGRQMMTVSVEMTPEIFTHGQLEVASPFVPEFGIFVNNSRPTDDRLVIDMMTGYARLLFDGMAATSQVGDQLTVVLFG